MLCKREEHKEKTLKWFKYPNLEFKRLEEQKSRFVREQISLQTLGMRRSLFFFFWCRPSPKQGLKLFYKSSHGRLQTVSQRFAFLHIHPMQIKHQCVIGTGHSVRVTRGRHHVVRFLCWSCSRSVFTSTPELLSVGMTPSPTKASMPQEGSTGGGDCLATN